MPCNRRAYRVRRIAELGLGRLGVSVLSGIREAKVPRSDAAGGLRRTAHIREFDIFTSLRRTLSLGR